MKLTRLALGACLALAFAQAQAGQTSPKYHATYLEYSRGWGSIVADFDGDGHDDIYVTGHDPDDRIWMWTPTGYVPGTQVYPWYDRHACVTADVNHDGLLDMYCAIGAYKGTGSKANELWIQSPPGVFTKAVNFGAEDTYGRGRKPLFFDLNHDGSPDIYITNEATARPDGEPNYNHVFVNQGNGTFVEQQTIATGNRGYACAAKGDINGDGWDDLLVCALQATSHVYINNKKNDFVELKTPATQVPWDDAKLVDMNGDGRDDLVLVNAEKQLQIWLNTGTAPYFPSATYTFPLKGKAVSIAIADFDGNGKKDIYVVLEDAECPKTLIDKAPDVVFWGQPDGTYVEQVQPQNDLEGCGHLADVVDGNKILLEQGAPSWQGPNYIIEWK